MKICFFCYDASKYGGVLTVQHEIMDSLKAEYEISVVSLVDHIEKNLRDNFDSHGICNGKSGRTAYNNEEKIP